MADSQFIWQGGGGGYSYVYIYIFINIYIQHLLHITGKKDLEVTFFGGIKEVS